MNLLKINNFSNTIIISGLSFLFCFSSLTNVYAATTTTKTIKSQTTSNTTKIKGTFDFWGDSASLNKVPNIQYTKTGIHIKTTETMLNTITKSSDCTTLAKQVLAGFKKQNKVNFARDLNSVKNEIYFHVQMEKQAHLTNSKILHEHTRVIDMEQTESYWNEFDQSVTDSSLFAGGVNKKYPVFIAKCKQNSVYYR